MEIEFRESEIEANEGKMKCDIGPSFKFIYPMWNHGKFILLRHEMRPKCFYRVNVEG